MRTLDAHAPPDLLMTAVPPTSFDPPTPFARGMAFAAYFLLLGALPTFGTSAVLALVVAYGRRDGATPLIRSHHQFQIRIFWIGLALAVAALALGAGAWIDAWNHPVPPHHFRIERSPDAQTIAYYPGAYHPGAAGPRAEPAEFYSWSYHSPGAAVGVRALLEGYGAMIAILFAGLWGILTPLWGAARLASGRPIGHSAP
jgi:hypothetical protein